MTVFGFFFLLFFFPELLYFYYLIPHCGQLQSTKKRNSCEQQHLEARVLNPLHLQSFWSSGLCADALFTYGQGLGTNYKADRMGEGSDLTAPRCVLCNRQLWARKRSLVNRSNNRLEKIWSQKYFKKCFKVIHFNCAMETLLARRLLPPRAARLPSLPGSTFQTRVDYEAPFW